jgi:O-acetyl-ADP-ribose deacetylase (regulator of RNase III)
MMVVVLPIRAVVVLIKEITKDVTTVEEGVVLHGCNCVGGFGSGVAGAIRRKWPDVYEAFMKNGVGEDLLGTTDFIVRIDRPRLVIANGYTQVFCGSDGKRYADVDAVEKCVMAGAEFADAFGLDLYMPQIGCGLGGLSWDDEVKEVVEKASLAFPSVNIFVCDL